MEEDDIKLIFGLKLKQIRTDKNLSLFGLSKLSGLSKSYLNEIENGKKYPKTDKIVILSEKLDVSYDDLVSLQLDKNLAPIGEILQSRILKEIPLELFGIKESDLIDIISNAPGKVNAFITTIIEVAKHYSFNRESFYLSSLRSYQQSNYNYFDDLEQQVVKFCKAYHIDLNKPVSAKELEEILVDEYGYKINTSDLKKHKELFDLRSVFVPKTKTLLLASHIDEAQRIFIYAKEIAYNYLNYDLRLYTFPWIKFDNFEQVLNNFNASYFAGALVLPRTVMIAQLKSLFQKDVFNKSVFIKTISNFTSSPETFYQRLTNLLPKDFNIQKLFFLRFAHEAGSSNFYLNKELHLPNQQSPHANETNEHYCRRWVSLKVLEQIAINKQDHIFDLQISQYPDDVSYLVFSSATKDPFKDTQYRSISIGLLIDKQLKRKIAFLQDINIKRQMVGVTCERCPITDCKERKVPPVILERTKKNKVIEDVVSELTAQFSKPI
ncbi:helix-turn-helix domain-containing protein [Maribacter litoralis]|uniref:helix-turn-helix domain-containing protein n=1 Tax=Maribacter litoralis TaxID=2059726 RepID=UPI000E3133DC|nr:helix-turn-helix domain-containing protein [Maribacter litoralis]|tara:strand:+ start:6418 stop:7899 length:1482 start_codon:yes stop_codon:yes gene_type:complete